MQFITPNDIIVVRKALDCADDKSNVCVAPHILRELLYGWEDAQRLRNEGLLPTREKEDEMEEIHPQTPMEELATAITRIAVVAEELVALIKKDTEDDNPRK